MIEKIIETIREKREMISYLFWGGCTTLVSWGSYSLLVKFFGVSIAVSNGCSWVLAILFAFVVNKWFVFQSKSWELPTLGKEFGKFLSARIATGAFEIAGVPLLVKLGLNQQIAGVDGAVAKVVTNVIVIFLNYFFSKFLVFKKSQ